VIILYDSVCVYLLLLGAKCTPEFQNTALVDYCLQCKLCQSEIRKSSFYCLQLRNAFICVFYLMTVSLVFIFQGESDSDNDVVLVDENVDNNGW